jgi:hypothetical protein
MGAGRMFRRPPTAEVVRAFRSVVAALLAADLDMVTPDEDPFPSSATAAFRPTSHV